MDNKRTGKIIIIISIVLFILLFSIKSVVDRSYDEQIRLFHGAGGACVDVEGDCPHTQKSKAQIPIYIGFVIVAALLILSFYLIFLTKGEKEIISLIKETKEVETKEKKFDIILKGMDEYEKKAIKAIKEQDGISQSTLRLRTDMSKAKLSLVLKGLEKKNLIKKENKGKINHIFLKESL
tara:strand:- start:412 stop:951 length:540 start_codon:yes stop_codon:yes gene_type:complete